MAPKIAPEEKLGPWKLELLPPRIGLPRLGVAREHRGLPAGRALFAGAFPFRPRLAKSLVMQIGLWRVINTYLHMIPRLFDYGEAKSLADLLMPRATTWRRRGLRR